MTAFFFGRLAADAKLWLPEPTFCLTALCRCGSAEVISVIVARFFAIASCNCWLALPVVVLEEILTSLGELGLTAWPVKTVFSDNESDISPTASLYLDYSKLNLKLN